MQQEGEASGIAFGSKPAEAAVAPKPEGQENISGASNGTTVQVCLLHLSVVCSVFSQTLRLMTVSAHLLTCRVCSPFYSKRLVKQLRPL